MTTPHFPSFEFIERVRADIPENAALVPNEIRVDGVPWAIAANHPITINSIELPSAADVCLVTFTVMARRVRIDSEVSEPH